MTNRQYSYRFLRTFLAVTALLLTSACGAGQPGSTPKVSGESTSTAATQPPDFELDTLDGGKFRLSDHVGKEVVLIDFWATWCDPCLASMHHLQSLYEKHKQDGFTVVGISIDGPESLAQVRTEVEKRNIKFPILLDQETRVVALYNPKTSAPYSVLIGRDGSIITKREGYSNGGAEAVTAEVEKALKN